MSLTFRNFSRLVALPHSVFALPFALASLILAFNQGALVPGADSLVVTVLLVVVAVISARTAAMAFNRLVDAAIDAKNPRTAGREIPAGKVEPRAAALVTIISSVVFLLASWLLGGHCLLLAPFELAWLLAYSYAKRFTPLAHLVLGFALALAPGGAWWVLRPEVELTPLLLMGAVLSWVAGFDILYSCQDVQADRDNGIRSIPATLGVDWSLRVARVCHVLCWLLFLGVGLASGLGSGYVIGLSLLAVPLVLQHRVLRPWDLSRINHAFFTLNGVVSLGYLWLIVLLCG